MSFKFNDLDELREASERAKARWGQPTRTVGIAIGPSRYIVVRNGQVVQSFMANGAIEAHGKQTEEGSLYIRVGG